jgi:hypothetical protein
MRPPPGGTAHWCGAYRPMSPARLGAARGRRRTQRRAGRAGQRARRRRPGDRGGPGQPPDVPHWMLSQVQLPARRPSSGRLSMKPSRRSLRSTVSIGSPIQWKRWSLSRPHVWLSRALAGTMRKRWRVTRGCFGCADCLIWSSQAVWLAADLTGERWPKSCHHGRRAPSILAINPSDRLSLPSAIASLSHS